MMMNCESRRRWKSPIPLMIVFAIVTIVAYGVRPFVATGRAQEARAASDPWTPAQTIEAPDLMKELSPTSKADRPLVVCVGFQALYRGGHVPGASYHGPTSSPEGLAEFKRWAQGISPTTNVVLYCGCCPFSVCPNVRPAFTTLRDMGFTHVRVLLLPTNFATDWVGKDLPIER